MIEQYSKVKARQEELKDSLFFLSKLLSETVVKTHMDEKGYTVEATVFTPTEIETIKDNMIILIGEYVETTEQLTDSLTDEQENQSI